ncbi:MAG: glycosyltransferase family 2 protein, partial [Actinomycetota bacterium]
HNEERVITGVVADLVSQEHELKSVWVLADRCTDATAELAKQAGALVTAREEGPDGKGAALAWFLERYPLDSDEALVVVDADNRVPRQLLSRFSDEIEAGHQAMQAYLDVANPDSSVLTTASALSYWASNRMVQLARTNLGWPADLGGTGLCITASALGDAGGFGEALTEDQDLGIRLFLAGHYVRWLHDVRVSDEKPVGLGVAIRQRGRWVSGRQSTAKRYGGDLLRTARVAGWDLALRIVQPSRIGVAGLSGALAVASAIGTPLSSWQMWATLATVQFFSPIPFLLRDGVPARYLLRYPLLVLLPILKLPGRMVRSRDWYHTPHGKPSK